MSEHTVCSSCRIDLTCPNDQQEPTAPCPVCTADVPLVDGKLIVHRHRDQFGPCPAGQVESLAPAPTGDALERLRTVERVAGAYAQGHHVLSEIGHDDIRVLMAEYERRADKLQLDAEEIRQYRITIRKLRAELAKTVADCGICRLGSRTIHINDDCPRHGDTDGEA